MVRSQSQFLDLGEPQEKLNFPISHHNFLRSRQAWGMGCSIACSKVRTIASGPFLTLLRPLIGQFLANHPPNAFALACESDSSV